MSGRIVEVLVSEGEEVVAGQVLARVDSNDLDQQIARAEAALATAQIRLEQQEVNRLVEDLNDLELWFTGRSITGGNVILGADYGLATISFRGAQEIERELLSYDRVMVETLGKVREEKKRLEKEVHIHELRKEQIIIGQKDEQLETPEEIYRREIQKYNVLPGQTTAEPGETGAYRPTYVPPTPTVTPGAAEGEPGLTPEEAPTEAPPAETPPEEAPAETPPEEAAGEEAEGAGGGEAAEEELPEPGAGSTEESEEEKP